MLNHYDPNDGLPPIRHPKVVEIAKRVVADYGANIDGYEEFRKKYFAKV